MEQTININSYIAEFKAETKRLNKVVAKLTTENARLNRRDEAKNVIIRSQSIKIKELEKRLSKYEDPEPQKNSNNSSVPPSKENMKDEAKRRPSQLKMIGRAVTDARDKAKIMVEALDCGIGEVVSINYRECGISVYSEARNIHSNKEAMSSTPDSLDITPDDLVMSDTVDVVFEIINPNE